MKSKDGKKMLKIILVVIYLMLTTTGLILMKKGNNPGTVEFNNGNMLFGMNIVNLIGFICYICSFLLFTRIVTMFDLSYIVPISTGIVQVVTLVAAFFVFKEEISKQGIIGATLVIAGIIVMNLKQLK